MEILDTDASSANRVAKGRFRALLLSASTTIVDVMFGNGRNRLIPEKPWLYLYDGKNTFNLETEVHGFTVAELYDEIAQSYGLKSNAKQHLRIVFIDREVKYSTRKLLSDYDIVNYSTISVVFLLPASSSSSSSFVDSDQIIYSRTRGRKRRRLVVEGDQVEEDRPQLSSLEGSIRITNMLPDFMDFMDFMDFEMRPDVYKAIMPCGHVMGSETMRSYVANIVANGHTSVPCPYRLYPVPFCQELCPAKWDYRLVRHVACFTTEEMHETEKAMTINYIGKDPRVLYCPGCITWCSRSDPKVSAVRCFLCSERTGQDFIFCGHCLKEWQNTVEGVGVGGCGNEGCNSVEARLEILRNSPVTQLYGGSWPTIRACPVCGILTNFLGQCTQMKCSMCGHYYCFLCLKDAKSKKDLRCIPYDSDCQRAPLQTVIPEWDGKVNTG